MRRVRLALSVGLLASGLALYALTLTRSHFPHPDLPPTAQQAHAGRAWSITAAALFTAGAVSLALSLPRNRSTSAT